MIKFVVKVSAESQRSYLCTCKYCTLVVTFTVVSHVFQEVVVYAKMTQTDVVQQERTSDNEEESELPPESSKLGAQAAEKAPQDADTERPPPTFSHLEFSGEQVDRIMATEDFSTFIDRASRLVERALCDSSDILFDYISGEGEEGG